MPEANGTRSWAKKDESRGEARKKERREGPSTQREQRLLLSCQVVAIRLISFAEIWLRFILS